MYDTPLGNLSVYVWLIIVIGVFLIAREIFLWYWKVNEMVNILKKHTDILEDIADSLDEIKAPKPVLPEAPASSGEPSTQRRRNPLTP